MENSHVSRSAGIAPISATAAGALAGERKKRAVLEAFQRVALTSEPLTPSVGWSVYTGRLIQKSASRNGGVAKKLLRSSSTVEEVATPRVWAAANTGSKRAGSGLS